jgi:hypothetical protein
MGMRCITYIQILGYVSGGGSNYILFQKLILSRLEVRAYQVYIQASIYTSHEEMKQTALKRDEEQVQAIVNHLNETMTDSFDIEAHPLCLMNISTGMHAC